MDLVYSTYLGGTDTEYPSAIVYDGSSNVYIGGYTDSNDFNVTAKAYQTFLRGWADSFLLKFDLAGRDIVYSTYYGGSSDTYISDLVIDGSGNVYACGFTSSGDLPLTAGANDTELSGWSDGFAMSLNAAGNGLRFATYIGGSEDDEALGIYRDAAGDLHVVGDTWSIDFPAMSGSFQAIKGDAVGYLDGWYMKLMGDGTGYHYSTYMGGANNDRSVRILVDEATAEPIILGETDSSDYPVKQGSYDLTHGGGAWVSDTFVTKLNLTLPPTAPRNLEATPGNRFVLLEWDEPLGDGGTPVTDYQVWKGSRSGGLSELAETGGNLSYNDTDVINGQTYYYKVQAINSAGPGMLTSEVHAMPASVPQAPWNVKAAYGSGVVNVTWNKPTDNGGLPIQGFRFYRFEGASIIPEIIDLSSDVDEYQDYDVQNGVNYRYYLTSYNSLGESLPSNEVNATPMTLPSMPTDLHLRSGPGFVHLTWMAPDIDGGSPILNYTLWRLAMPGTWGKYVKLPGDVLEYNDTAVINGNTYKYRIAASNSEGSSIPTEEIVAIPLDRPEPPASLEAEPFSGSVRLSWTEPFKNGGSPVLGYVVYRHESSDIWTSIKRIDSTDGTYTDYSVKNGRTYRYRVSAFNQIGESDMSEEANATPRGKPHAPMVPTITWGDRFVMITWEEPNDDGGDPIVEYRIFRGETQTEIGFYRSVTADKRSFNDTPVANGKTYHYTVKAANVLGDSPPTEVLSASPAGVPNPPATLNAVPSDASVMISWTRPMDDGGDPVTEVRIFRGTTPGQVLPLVTIGESQGSYRDGTVANGVTYYYRMTASNSIGESGFTQVVEATPSGKPAAPTSMSVKEKGGGVEITWMAPTNDGGSPITGYRIYRTNEFGDRVQVKEVPSSVLTYLDDGVKAGKEYSYAVTAVNANGEGAFPEQVDIKTKEEASFNMLIIIIPLLAVIAIIVGIAVVVAMNRKKDRPQVPLPGGMVYQGMPPVAPVPGQLPPPGMYPPAQMPMQPGLQPGMAVLDNLPPATAPASPEGYPVEAGTDQTYYPPGDSAIPGTGFDVQPGPIEQAPAEEPPKEQDPLAGFYADPEELTPS